MNDDKIIEETMVYLRNHSNPNLDIGYTHYEIENAVKFAIQKTREEMINKIKEFIKNQIDNGNLINERGFSASLCLSDLLKYLNKLKSEEKK